MSTNLFFQAYRRTSPLRLVPLSIFSKMRGIFVVTVFCSMILFGCAAQQMKQPVTGDSQKLAEYWPSTACRNCHGKIYEQQTESMHAWAFENPVFKAQYFGELMLAVQGNDELRQEADKCIACHAPVAFLKYGGHITSQDQIVLDQAGVTCDFCHTLTGFKGEKPGGGNYVSTPGEDKFGPFKHAYNWHHLYAKFQTTSEFCAVCHNDVNHHGLEIKSTYTEWKKSPYAQRGIGCQNCHMNLHGFLVDDKPAYESGQASTMSMGPSYMRNRLYSHRFPGAHSKTQIEGALMLGLRIDSAEISPGEDVTIYLHVFNKKAGHTLPSGSADLRVLWLELSADIDGKTVQIPAAVTSHNEVYDVAGRGAFDGEILGGDVPEGSRLYRTIYLDKNGERTLSSYDAVQIVFDNRLRAEELRKETFHFSVPIDIKGPVIFIARLNYLRYPGSFAARLGIPKTEPVELASAKKEIRIR